MKKTFVVLLCCTILVGCAPTKVVISPLRYDDKIGFYAPKVAHIYWLPGRRIASAHPTYVASDSSGNGLAGLIGAMVVSAVDQQQRKNNPSKYSNEYGKADEVVFVTSLRDILIQQNVFKRVELTTDLKKVKPQEVLIKIYFKTARVIDVSHNKLTVDLSIKARGYPLYERTYFVQNDPCGIFETSSFVDKKTEVSKKLLTAIIGGIKKWHEGNKK